MAKDASSVQCVSCSNICLQKAIKIWVFESY